MHDIDFAETFFVIIGTCAFNRAWADKAHSVDEAHSQAECSNRGKCNRKTVVNNDDNSFELLEALLDQLSVDVQGICDCFSGYEGEACQRGEPVITLSALAVF